MGVLIILSICLKAHVSKLVKIWQDSFQLDAWRFSYMLAYMTFDDWMVEIKDECILHGC